MNLKKKIVTSNVKAFFKQNFFKEKKIVLCHGVFDVLHIGHIKHFEDAKKNGDILVVSVTTDKFVNKGFDRPYFNQKLRMEMIASMSCVDYVVLSNYSTAVEVINFVRPNIYFKGSDYRNMKKDLSKNIFKEKSAIKKIKGKMIFSDNIVFSSSKLINKFSDNINIEQKKYIKNVKKIFEETIFEKKLDIIKKYKVLVVGETIIDEYIFSDILGKSGKESYLATCENYREKYLGGAAAVANNSSSFSDNVTFLSLGESQSSYNKFIKNNLNVKIKPLFIESKNRKTIVKSRYIDKINGTKLFGAYQINDDELNKNETEKIEKKIKLFKQKFDVAIIVDYGHGFLNNKLVNLIRSKSNFLAINAQVNSSNFGFHSLRKYNKGDLLIINANELRHETRDRNGDIFNLTKKFTKSNNFKKIIVTMGKDGAIDSVKNRKKLIKCPAFTSTVVDKIGAGDTMLSIISLFEKSKISSYISLMLGCLAGAFSVQTIGNKRYLDKVKILKNFYTYLK